MSSLPQIYEELFDSELLRTLDNIFNAIIGKRARYKSIDSNEGRKILSFWAKMKSSIEKRDFFTEGSKNSGKTIVRIKSTFEKDLIDHVIPTIKHESLYHYTTFESFWKILENGTIKLSSILGLNDKSELNFTDLSTIKQNYHPTRMNKFSRTFIFSLSKLEDNLNQWRLYGDDGQGVCLFFKPKNIFSIARDPNLQLREIFYGDDVVKIFRRIKAAVEKVENAIFLTDFNENRHFFKKNDYEYEEEVRFLLFDNKEEYKIHWDINRFDILNPFVYIPLEDFPLQIMYASFGPKMKEREQNLANAEHFIRQSNLSKFPLGVSTIDSYR